MTSLAKHHSNTYVKLLLIGDPKTGKTGSLVSLVEAGYKLCILDMDNLLDILKYLVLHKCPDKIDNVESRTLRDKRKSSASGSIIDGSPVAFVEAVKMLDKWKYTDEDGTVIDLGPPAQWGPEYILVIDSLSRLCDAAYDWRESLAVSGGKYDQRAVYGDAQDAVESLLAGLTSKSFATNLIVIAHLQYMDLPDGSKKGFPQGIGAKLSPKIPSYFSSVVHFKNKNDKRTMCTTSSALIDLANPAPFLIEKEYPTETGLALFFQALLNRPQEATTAKTNPIRTISSLNRK